MCESNIMYSSRYRMVTLFSRDGFKYMIETRGTQETHIPSFVSLAGAKSGNSSTEGGKTLLISSGLAMLLFFYCALYFWGFAVSKGMVNSFKVFSMLFVFVYRYKQIHSTQSPVLKLMQKHKFSVSTSREGKKINKRLLTLAGIYGCKISSPCCHIEYR